MSNSEERELVDSTSSKNTGHHVKGWGCHSTIKNSDLELSLSKRTAGTKLKKRPKERRSSDNPNLESHAEAPRPGTVSDAVVFLQTGA